MNGDIEVSVICITYNQIKYIEKALRSIVSQKTNFRFEVIVHDDASTDGTTDIVRTFSKKYPDLIIPILQNDNQYSKNIRATSLVLPKARGKYFAFCEGDDYWCDEFKLQKQYNVMEANPDCSICVHKTQNINEDGSLYPSVQGEYWGVKEGILDRETVCKLFLQKPTTIFHTSSFFIRLSMFKKIYLSEPKFAHYSTGGDQIILRICLTEGNYYFLDQIMSCYRRFAKGSINSRQKEATVEYWREYYLNYAISNSEFDFFSKFKFHKYIRGWIGINIMNLGKYDVMGARELLKRFEIRIKDIYISANFKYFVKYVCIRYFPHICYILYKIKKLVKNFI